MQITTHTLSKRRKMLAFILRPNSQVNDVSFTIPPLTPDVPSFTFSLRLLLAIKGCLADKSCGNPPSSAGRWIP